MTRNFLCFLLRCSTAFVCVVGGLLGSSVTAQVTSQPDPFLGTSDVSKILKSAGLKITDPDSFYNYLKQRTLSEADSKRINDVLTRMSDESYDVREAASKEILTFGPAAIGPLRKASEINPAKVNETDFECAYRAQQALKVLETVPHQKVSEAVIRVCAANPRPELTKVILDFIPFADGSNVTSTIRKVLAKQALRDGKVDLHLLDALKEGNSQKRLYAAEALMTGGDSKSLIRIPSAYPAVLAAIKAETDAETKFTMQFLAASISLDREALSELLDSIPTQPRGYLWKTEDLLLQLAGKEAPKALFGKSEESVKAAQALWQEWWNANRDKLPTKDWAYVPRIQGNTLIIALDQRIGLGYVAELGPDMKEKWRINNLPSPYDALVLPNDQVVIAEMNTGSITYREFNGTLIAKRQLNGDPKRRIYGSSPQQLQMLPDGTIMVVCRNHLALVAPDDKQQVIFDRANDHDITAATRLPNGETAILIQNGPNHLIFIDKEFKPIEGRNGKLNQPWYQSFMIALGDDRILFTETNQIVEWDIKQGKVLWKKASMQARCLQRLPNGNTLYVDGNQANNSRLVEVAPSGDEVWSYTLPTGFYMQKAYRR